VRRRFSKKGAKPVDLNGQLDLERTSWRPVSERHDEALADALWDEALADALWKELGG
jgi:hypothetical protein